MNDDRLTEKLANQILGWKLAPGRFIKSDRSWTPSWRFAPLSKLEDAFDLLDASGSAYVLATNMNGGFDAEVHLGGRIGRASGMPKARTITIALARALGLDPADDVGGQAWIPAGQPKQLSRRKVDRV